MAYFFNSWVSVVLVWALFGCASVSTTVPIDSGEGPRTVGEAWKLKGDIEYDSSRSVLFTDDASARPPNLNRKEIAQSSLLIAGAGLGLTSIMDVFAKVAMSNTWIYGLRIQPIGDSRRSSSHTGIVAAVNLWGYRSSSNKSGDQNGTFGPGGFKWDSSVLSNGDGLEALIGFHLGSSLLFFVGPSQVTFRAEGNIHHAKSDDNSSPEANYVLKGSGSSRVVKVGLELLTAEASSLTVSGYFGRMIWENLEDSSISGISGAIQF